MSDKQTSWFSRIFCGYSNWEKCVWPFKKMMQCVECNEILELSMSNVCSKCGCGQFNPIAARKISEIRYQDESVSYEERNVSYEIRKQKE